ncbi:MAG: DUF423 domain-containing protein [Dehalococcoidia bacterium]
MEQTWFLAAAVLGFLAVGFGAFAAHSLKARLSSDDLATFETAARYQMYHALALLGVSYAAYRWGGGLTTAAGWLFVGGVVLFSGSLYVLAISGIKVLGAITPLGGLCFLAGWACLGLAAWKGR